MWSGTQTRSSTMTVSGSTARQQLVILCYAVIHAVTYYHGTADSIVIMIVMHHTCFVEL